jgi:hypothetical protein
VTRRNRRCLSTIKNCLKQNGPKVQLLLARSTTRPGAALVFPLTVYFKTLKKLAKE